MNTPRLVIDAAKYPSRCPECGGSIGTGSLISRQQDGTRYFRCDRCTAAELRPVLERVDPLNLVISHVVDEFRLHRLAGSPTQPVVVIRKPDGQLTWRYQADITDDDETIVATVVCLDDVVLTSTVTALRPHVVLGQD